MTPLEQLVQMTRTLGQPHNEYVIVGEGNTSYRLDDDSFLIKASGQGMSAIDENGFVAVRFDPIMALFDQPNADRAALQQAMIDAKVDSAAPGRPSVEVTFHAMLLRGCGVNVIAHTHPVAVNSLLCSTRARQFADNRIFPDEAVVCGPRSVFVPYVDPGLPLAVAIRDEVKRYMDDMGEAPKVVLLANHGLIALAHTPLEALNITAMAVKAAKIFMGACAVGQPVFMSQADIMHIYRRPDEIYRRQMFVG